jgi:hypothetical protein
MKTILALALVFWSSIALAKTCKDDSIATVSDDGSIIKMLSGSVWEIDAADQVDSFLWLAAGDVLICTEMVNYQGKRVALYAIINTDNDNEQVGVDRLR